VNLFKFILILFISSCFFIACRSNDNKGIVITKEKPVNRQLVSVKTSKDSILSNDYLYYGDSVIKSHKSLLAYYFKKYDRDSCASMAYAKSNLKENYKGFKDLGDVNGDRKSDSVFVLRPLNFCEYDDGQSYYFTDPTLPRLRSRSYCCHPKNIFSVGDIDEDGISEIGQYYSSCASRYKSLLVYSLKNAEWKQVGRCVYDLFYNEYGADFSRFVKKTGKNRFEMLEVTDLTEDTSKAGKANWLKFTL
jgi:hypothetical protein